jgi:hypothetical protein
MKKLICQLLITTILLFSCAVPAFANEETVLSPSVAINEIQTNGSGSGTTAQEFIELTNLSSGTVDITGWTVEYVNTSGNATTIHTFSASGSAVLLYPGGYSLGVCKDAPIDFLADLTPKFVYNACIAASGAGLVLKNSEDVIIDSLYWVSGPDSFSEDIVPLLAGGSSIQRRIIDGQVVCTGNNVLDFEVLSEPTPSTENISPDETIDEEEPLPEPTPTPEAEPTPTPTEEPIEEEEEVIPEVYLSLLLSELYIDPVEPLSDSQDEWVEIYNPNNEAVDLEGYTIYTGATFSYKHVFGSTDIIDANSYLTISSGTSSLALSNSGGAAKIIDPDGQILDQTTYESAKEGQAWAKTVDGNWQWTATPTGGAVNIFTLPQVPVVIKKATTAAASTKKATTKTTTAAKSTKTTEVKATTDDNIKTLINAPSPLPNWLLAILGGLAVIYCLYEYRYEVSNKIYQLRHYKEHRRPNWR